MPPKRKAQEISRAESSPPANVRTKGEAVTGGPDTPIRGELAPLDLSSPWTDDQEIALFKSVIRWKPAGKFSDLCLSISSLTLLTSLGMHKHFRMLSISQQIQNQAYDESEATDTHIRIPGIWQKLGTLYNLEAIDSREDSFQEEGRDDGSTDSDPHEEPFHEFILPEEEYGDSMFDRRLNPEGTSSPPLLEKRRSPARKRGGRRAEGNTSARASTIEDTEEGLCCCTPLAIMLITISRGQIIASAITRSTWTRSRDKIRTTITTSTGGKYKIRIRRERIRISHRRQRWYG
jgi:MRG-binding protein